jgi:hypothetical protein
MKNRIVFAVAFAVGLAVVAWVGWRFVGSSWLAFWMTLVIAAVYLLGAFELRQFRAATATLTSALDELQQPLAELEPWLARVHASLRHPVRLRVEGERVGLPGPALTPYLVGLLVMLGMLGTFVGMVITFKGAVFALEGSTDLAAVRSALAAPIKGLGLSFGTSVAGVAASAMLGLLSALSRRERADAARQLDSRIATVLRPFSLAHQRHENFKALPAVVGQLQALAEQVERRGQQLDAQLLERQNQFHVEASAAYTGLATSVASTLQDSLAASARAASDSLRPVVESAMAGVAQESLRLHERVGDTVQTQLSGLATQFSGTAHSVADTWAAALAQQAHTQAQLVDGLGQALGAFTDQFAQRSGALLAEVQQALGQSHAAQTQADAQQRAAWLDALQTSAASLQQEWRTLGAQTLVQQQAIGQTLEQNLGRFTERSTEQSTLAIAGMARLLAQGETMLQERTATEARWAAQQGERMDQVAAQWRTELAALRQDEATRGEAAVQRLSALQAEVTQHLGSLGSALEGPMGRLLEQSATLVRSHTEAEARRSQQHQQRLDELSAHWRSELAALRSEEAARGEAAVQRLAALQAEVTQHLGSLGSALEGPMGRLLEQSGALVRSHTEAEARWSQQHQQRMDELSAHWRSELAALRSEEGARGEAAVQRLGALQAALSTHLATLGTALEAPMARLLETASEAPRAAADMVLQLRQQMRQLAERDTQALQERAALVAQTNTLLQGVHQATDAQRAAIEALVASASAVLEQTGQQFAQTLVAQAGQSQEVAAQVGASAAELASLGEAFQHGVQLFGSSSQQLVDSLQRMEAAIGHSMARSDEQLAYYVGQAREVIDLSISAQQGIVEDLRRLHGQQLALAGENA